MASPAEGAQMVERVVVGLSGGVDSSIAAARLRAMGYEVVGATLRLFDPPRDGSASARLRLQDSIDDARSVAERLGIAHHVLDWREAFDAKIVAPFVEGYLSGRTPSPCVHCNRGIKLPALLGLAERLGVGLVATGHYARIEFEGRMPRLYRALDRARDQSYFLQWIGPDVLRRLLLPLGIRTKSEVRTEAKRLGLRVADREDSLELCFVPEGRYAEFVAARAGNRIRPGPILDATGQQVGTHQGIHAFTIGQRHNLGVALGRRAFVAALDVESSAVHLGSRDDVLAAGARLVQVRLDDDVRLPLSCDAVVRYRAQPTPAEVSAGPDQSAEVRFADPVAAVVPGQFVALYSGDRVLGGAMIEEAVPVGRAVG
jgi:tRNA-specific 2-thiouridylase